MTKKESQEYFEYLQQVPSPGDEDEPHTSWVRNKFVYQGPPIKFDPDNYAVVSIRSKH